jgi:hypothetical protein
MGEIDANLIDWQKLEHEVVKRIRMLAATATKLDAPEEWRRKIFDDLVMPNVMLLVQFIECIEEVDVDEEDRDA